MMSVKCLASCLGYSKHSKSVRCAVVFSSQVHVGSIYKPKKSVSESYVHYYSSMLFQ